MKILELRVHGVSNSPPESVLLAKSAEDVERVGGDEITGLYRRKDADPLALVDVEAYSWGQLTAGVRARKDLYRALWLLLLPFAFVNVAFWSRVRFPGSGAEARSDGLTSYLARLLALTLTATFALALTGVAADLVAWQWQRAELQPPESDQQAAAAVGQKARAVTWLAFLHAGGGWWSEGSRPLGFALFTVFVALVGLAFIARRSFAYEAEVPDVAPSDVPSPQPGLLMSHPQFWRGDQQVRRLASVHLATALAVAGGATAGPVLAANQHPRWPAVVLAGALGLVLVAAVVVIGLPTITHRTDQRVILGGERVARSLAWVGGGVVLLVVGYLLFASPATPAALRLPGYALTIRVLFLWQVFIVIALALSACWSARPARGGVLVIGLLATTATVPAAMTGLVSDRWTFVIVLGCMLVAALLSFLPISVAPLTGSPGSRRLDLPAWRGAGAALLGGVGVLLGAFYSAGVMLYAADWLNGKGDPIGIDRSIRPAASLQWAAVGLVPFLAVLVAFGLGALWWLHRTRRALYDDVIADFKATSLHQRVRAKAVAGSRAVHRFVSEESLSVAGGVAAVIGIFGVLPITAAASLGRTPAEIWSPLASLTGIGTRASVVLLGAVAAAGALVYRADAKAKGVGVVWDLATFWPRACHPFAPPCYAERCVPQMVTRIAGDDVATGYILAGHSQGAVLSLATVQQLPVARRDKIFLLTFGTQLHRLYGRAFPAFFGPAPLHGAANLLHDTDPPWLRWRSLHRNTDYLGYPVDVRITAVTGGQQVERTVDHPGFGTPTVLRDPSALSPRPGDIVDPPIKEHSDYPADPVYCGVRDDAAARLAGLLPGDAERRCRRDTRA